MFAHFSLYPLLCRDETPMVRRAAFSHIGSFASVMAHDEVLQCIVPALGSLCADEQDSVRLLSPENCVAAAKALTEEESVRENKPYYLYQLNNTTRCA